MISVDLLMQGTILAAVGTAATSVPTWVGVLLALGAYVAPLTLGCWPFGPSCRRTQILYRGLSTAVLTGLTIAWGRAGGDGPLALSPGAWPSPPAHLGAPRLQGAAS